MQPRGLVDDQARQETGRATVDAGREHRRTAGTLHEVVERRLLAIGTAVLVTDDFLPVATEIKGVVAREITERFPKVAAIAAGVV